MKPLMEAVIDSGDSEGRLALQWRAVAMSSTYLAGSDGKSLLSSCV